MTIRNVTLLVAFALCGCSTTSRVQTASAAKDQSFPYVAVDLTERSIYPQALARGELLVANGCVVLDDAGSLRTPIFPRGSRLTSNRSGNLELIAMGKHLRFGESYLFSGGEVPLSSAITLAEPAPAACPTAYWIVGNVNQD